MTFEEKLRIENPGMANYPASSIFRGCPYHYGYERVENREVWCGIGECDRCWNRTIPETEPANKNEREEKQMDPITTRKTKAELLEEIDALKKEVATLERYKSYEQGATDAYALLTSFVNAGFTREEAFQLIVTGISSTAKK